MNLKKIVGLGAVACTLLVACGKKKADENTPTLVVGVCADYAPFEFYKEGNIVGFDIDLMNEIGKRMDKKIEFKDMSFDAIIGSLTSERIDAGISSINPTPERQKSVDFTKNYIMSTRMMVCPETSNIETASDLSDATIGVQSGSTHESYAKDILSKEVRLTVKSLSKIPDLIQDMKAGRLTCIVMGSIEAGALVKSNDKLKTISLPGEASASAIGLPKGSIFKVKMDKILTEMEMDGTLANLKEKWLEK